MNPIEPSTDIDFLGIGEILVDMIATERGASLLEARTFQRHLGGSPANIAVNVARLGGRSAIIGRVGRDPLGQFLLDELRQDGVLVEGVQIDREIFTSLVFVTRGLPTPEFLPVRGADAHLSAADLSTSLLDRARILHASTFALSSRSAREAIAYAFRWAHERRKIISLDPNYSPQLWPDRSQALNVLRSLYPFVTITKPSMDDAYRLFGQKLAPETYVEYFHDLGATTVVLSMASEGVLLSTPGQPYVHIPARPLAVVDATGAGDAFWAGFLLALLDGLDLSECARVGQSVAEMKLQQVGPLHQAIDRQQIYQQIGK